jgi:hypothetical protein
MAAPLKTLFYHVKHRRAFGSKRGIMGGRVFGEQDFHYGLLRSQRKLPYPIGVLFELLRAKEHAHETVNPADK